MVLKSTYPFDFLKIEKLHRKSKITFRKDSYSFCTYLYLSFSFFCLSRFVCFFLVLCGCCHILLILLLASSQFSSTYSALLIAFETTLKENTTSIIRKVNEKICSCQIISYTYINLTIFGHTKLLINLFEGVT